MEYIPNNTGKSLAKLAYLCDISVKHGWKKILAAKVDVPQNSISRWIKRNNIPEKRLVEIENRSFPRDRWLVKFPPYPEPREDHSSTEDENQRSPTAMSFSAPDLDGYEPVKVYEPCANIPLKHLRLIRKVLDIMESGEEATARALVLNIEEFHDKIEKERRAAQELNELRREVEDLKKSIGLSGLDPPESA